ncbi:MAG: histidine kinase [Desulfatitalea sp.]|nr:histidine kinase [Desulfatitalea sp.]NNJ98866.1 histidine kinase [Desulfatitalea sp.]
MDDGIIIKSSQISKRLLLRYYPFWFFFVVMIAISDMYMRQGSIVAVAIFILVVQVYTFINYGVVVLPLNVFKPNHKWARLFVMLASMLGFIILLNILEAQYTGDAGLSGFGANKSIVAAIGKLHVGIFIVWFLYIEEQQYVSDEIAKQERAKRIHNEKRVLESHLKLLQAQIEPHFIFNTLTSIESLDDVDPQGAKTMQMNFIRYLEASLVKVRAEVTTVGQEVALIRSYLDLFKVRMGERLEYEVDVPRDVQSLPFPSMLIQPIVENAIKHGLEPKVDGGHIHISVRLNNGVIRWEIADTGRGMTETSNFGVGLSNIMERTESLYGDQSSVVVEDNFPSGVRVILEAPHVRES